MVMAELDTECTWSSLRFSRKCDSGDDCLDRGWLDTKLLELGKSEGRHVIAAHQGNLVARQRRTGEMFSEPSEGMP